MPHATEITEMTPAKADDSSYCWLRPELVASWREITAVLILTQGYYICLSTRAAMARAAGHLIDLRSSNYREIHLMLGESAILALLLLFLHQRKWTPVDFKIRPTW